MNPQIVIPARFASGRFPGKPLALINGKPLIRWTWEAAMRTGLPVLIATDDDSIESAARAFGAEVVMTSRGAKNGTERCAEVMMQLGREMTIINWQGDAPLMPAIWPHRLIEALAHLRHFDVATIAVLGQSAPGSVHVDTDSRGCARRFLRVPSGRGVLHQGIYAYRSGALGAYPALPIPQAERMESLEQLRWAPDFQIGVLVEPAPAWPLAEVNFPQDIESVAAVLSRAHAAP